jgi:DNA replication protein DnaC
MSEMTMARIRENLENLKMKNTLETLDNYLERAVKDNLNIVEVLDHIFSQEALSKRQRAYDKQIQMSGFPIKKTLILIPIKNHEKTSAA